MQVVIGIGLLIVVLLIAAVCLFRAGSGLIGGVFLLVAFALFCTTPFGEDVPGTVAGWFDSADTSSSSVVQQGGDQ